MYSQDIECKIICPRCGENKVYHDIKYVYNQTQHNSPMTCPVCHHRFNVTNNDVKYFHKPSKSSITISENEKTRRKILSLMERVERKKILYETALLPVSHNTEITLDNGVKTTSLVCISDGVSIFHIGEDDHCYKMYKENSDGTCSAYETSYIFPEMFNELKKLPNLPLH